MKATVDRQVPLTRAEFWTEDLDEAVVHLRQRFVEHSRVPLGRDPFGWGYRSLAMPAATVGRVRNAGGHVLRSSLPEGLVIVHLPLERAAAYRIGQRSWSATPERAVVLPPQHSYTVQHPGGDVLSLAIEVERLCEALEVSWPGRRSHLCLQAVELALTPTSRSRLFSLLRRLVRGAACSAPAGQALVAASLEDELVDWLARELVRARGVRPLGPGRRQRVALLERWIDDHLGEQIDLERLADAAGVGPRALAKDTSVARGVTPLGLVRIRRLERARRLLAAGSAETVAGVAGDCGFSHWGRFSSAYREAYGELPSDTLARCRDRA